MPNIQTPGPLDKSDVVTIVRDRRNPLGKRFILDAAGKVTKTSEVKVNIGEAIMRRVPTPEALAAVLREVTDDPHAALILDGFSGVEIGEPFVILSEKEIAKQLGEKGRPTRADTQGMHRMVVDGRKIAVVGRLKENVVPGNWCLADRDVDEHTPEQFKHADNEKWVELVDRVIPGFAAADRVHVPSASQRVTRDGEAVGKGNGHTFFRVRDAADLDSRARHAMRVRAIELGLAWKKPRISRQSGAVNGYADATVLDLSTLVGGRLVFDGAPTVGAGLQLTGAVITVHTGSARSVDTSVIALPDNARLREICAPLGMNLQIKRSGETVKVEAFDLRLATEIEVDRWNGVEGTVLDIDSLLLLDSGPLRCQAPFRDSQSWAGKFNYGRDGRPFVHDVGTSTTHWLCDEDWIPIYTANVRREFEPVVLTPAEQKEGEAVRARNALKAERETRASIEKANAIPMSELLARVDAAALPDEDSRQELLSTTLEAIMVGRYSASEEARAVRTLASATKTPVGAIKKDLSRARKRGPESKVALASIEWPVATARAVIAERYSAGGQASIRRWQGMFYAWNGRYYSVVSDEDVRSAIYGVYKHANVDVPHRGPIDNTIDAMKAEVNVPAGVNMPSWVGGAPPANPSEIMAVRNGLLHLPTRCLLPHDPRFFNGGAVDVDFDTAAPAPAAWLTFLSTVFPRDAESIAALQQWFGYLLTSATHHHKALICVGPPRSGKGTIGRVLRGLVGEANYAGPSLNQLGRQFGKQDLISKTLAMVSDARLSGQADLQAAVEVILNITGEDTINVERKGLPDWVGKLNVRFVLLTNILPGLVDPGGALGTRFVVLRFTQSFLGREDTGLTGKLIGELPGILNWALDGQAVLHAKGAFTQPRSGVAAVNELRRRTTPLLGFMEDRLEITDDLGNFVEKDALYQVYKRWCEAEGMKFFAQKNNFFAELYANSGGRLMPVRPRIGGDRVNAVGGVNLQSAAQLLGEFE